jgi:hypothetical protein
MESICEFGRGTFVISSSKEMKKVMLLRLLPVSCREHIYGDITGQYVIKKIKWRKKRGKTVTTKRTTPHTCNFLTERQTNQILSTYFRLKTHESPHHKEDTLNGYDDANWVSRVSAELFLVMPLFFLFPRRDFSALPCKRETAPSTTLLSLKSNASLDGESTIEIFIEFTFTCSTNKGRTGSPHNSSS